MPDDLRARLRAANVADNASLMAALQADPVLRADFDAFLQANADALAAATINTLLQAFAQVADDTEMAEFCRAMPSELQRPLIEAVEAIIEQATAAGDDNTVQNLSERLEVFRRLSQKGQLTDELPPVMRAVMGFFEAPSDAAAEQFFASQRDLLQTSEAQRAMDVLVEQAPPDIPANVRQLLLTRQALLRRLREEHSAAANAQTS